MIIEHGEGRLLLEILETATPLNLNSISSNSAIEIDSLSRGSTMPLPLKATAINILELIDDPYTNVSTIKKFVLGDVALCVRLLKHAQSSTYSRNNNIDSINNAIMVLGWRNIRGIIASAAIPSIRRVNTKEDEEIWAQSACRAIACTEIANILAPDLSDELSSIALLLGVGRTILNQKLPDLYKEVLQQVSNGFTYSEAEQTSFGFISPSLSRMLCKRWSLSPNIVSVLAALADGGTQQEELSFKADVIALADLLSLQMGLEQSPTYPDVNPQISALVMRLDLDSGALAVVSSRTEQNFNGLCKLV